MTNEERDQAAAEYFSSEAFMDNLRRSVQSVIVDDGKACVYVGSKMSPEEQDLPYLTASFNKVKEEFPGVKLNHVRINNGSAAGVGRKISNFLCSFMGSVTVSRADQIIVDTKKNQPLRRFKGGVALFS